MAEVVNVRAGATRLPLAVALTAALMAVVVATPRVLAQRPQSIADRLMALTRTSSWRFVRSIPVGFRTFHPQGMVKIGDTFYVSSVEVTAAPQRFASPSGGFDRSPGAGVGHLFKVDDTGRLLGTVKLGEGTMYHPGGIDYDGQSIWVPVAEYRPDSRSIVYRLDPATLLASEVLRVADHIGGIVHNTDDRTLHGVSWGSRRFYRWRLDAAGRVLEREAPLASIRTLNPSHYIDYQDCHYAGARQMACTGLADYRPTPGGPAFRLGGIELVSLVDGRPVHQVPLPLWTVTGRPMTQNPAWLEVTETGLRAYFMPDDDQSVIAVYETGSQ
jgi:hypothetical protein